MKIGITQRVIEHDAYKDRRDSLSQDWASWVNSIIPGAILIPIPNTLADPKQWCEANNIGAIVSSNGNDYGEAPDRDSLEKSVLEWAMTARRPLFGVCRGLQVINIELGGGLCEDIKQVSGESHVTASHEIDIVDTSFRSLLGRNRLSVNSYHNQGVTVDKVAAELRVFATRGNCVEGIYHPEKPILAIQWHPERDNIDAKAVNILVSKFLQEGIVW